MSTTDERLRIAICDDHPLFRAGLRDLLRSDAGFELVFEAGSLAELRGLASDVDVLLLDVGLPDGSGLDAVGEFARRSKVLVVSALDEPRTMKRAFELGAIGFLRKDAPASEVLAGVRRAASGQTVLSAAQALSVARALRDEGGEGAHARAIAALSSRQLEVLALVADGKSNREIGRALFISEGTVKNHVTQILRTLEVTDRTRLALLVAKHDLLP